MITLHISHTLRDAAYILDANDNLKEPNEVLHYNFSYSFYRSDN